MAWLSTGTVSAASRLGTASGWVRPDGLPIASTAADLLAGRIIHPVAIDEFGADQRTSTERGVWTGSLPDGSAGSGASMASHCSGWTSTTSTGTIGSLDRTTGGWTAFEQAVTCNDSLHIYCFGTSRPSTDVVPPPPAPGGSSRVFVTARTAVGNGSGTWGGTGLMGFDNMCNSEPGRPPGTYRAYLGTMSMSAASRIPGSGPFLRPDGWALGGSGAVLSGAAPLVAGMAPPMGTSPNQPYWVNTWEVWTGMENGPMATGAGINTCSGWASVSTGTGGGVGHPDSTALGGLSAGLLYPGWARGTPVTAAACSTPRHVYCVQVGP